MKKYINYLAIVMFSILIASCKKDDLNYPDGYVGISKITVYPEIVVTGSKYVSVVKGSTYTDAGAKAGSLAVTSSGTVNTNTVGVYTITYGAVNSDGFAGSAVRYIAVLPSADQGIDISGKYDYAAGGKTVNMTKLAPGFYYVEGLYSAATTIPAYLICVNGTNITVPSQSTAYGNLNGTAVLAGLTPGSTLNYVINLPDQGIAGTTRRWIRK